MIKLDTLHNSRFPAVSNHRYTNNASNDLQSTIRRNTIVDIGPWNAQNENVNEYLDTELSLSKYNRGFGKKQFMNSKKKSQSKKKKRSLSQMDNPHHNTSLNTYMDDHEFILNDKNQTDIDENNIFIQQNEIINNIDQIQINDSSIIKNNELQQNYFNQYQSQQIQTQMSQYQSQMIEQIQKRDIQQENKNNNQEIINYIIKTEPQISSTSITSNQQKVNKFLENQLNNKHKCFVKRTKVRSHIDINTQYNNNNNLNNVSHSESAKENHSEKEQIPNHLYIKNNNKITSKEEQQNLVGDCTHSKEISTQSHSIEDSHSYQQEYKSNNNQQNSQSNQLKQQDGKKSYSSFSSLLSHEQCNDNQVALYDLISQQRKTMDQKNKQNSQNVTSSMHSTPLVTSPQKMANIFQISATHYHQNNNNNNNIPQNYNQSISIERRLKTEGVKIKSHQFQQQQFPKIQIRAASQQSCHNFAEQISQDNYCRDNNIQASFSPISRVNSQNNQNNDQFHSTQNHLKVSHYQSNKNQNTSSYQQPLFNSKADRIILREIVLATNNNSLGKQINRYSNNQEKKILNNRERNLKENNIKIKTNIYEQRKNILQSCLADSMRQSTYQSNNQQYSSFITSSHLITSQKINPNINYSNSHQFEDIQKHSNHIHQSQNNYLNNHHINNLSQTNYLNNNNNNNNNINNSVNNNLDQLSQNLGSTILYRKARCSINQLTFQNNFKINYPQNLSKQSQEGLGDNNTSIYKSCMNETQLKRIEGQKTNAISYFSNSIYQPSKKSSTHFKENQNYQFNKEELKINSEFNTNSQDCNNINKIISNKHNKHLSIPILPSIKIETCEK